MQTGIEVHYLNIEWQAEGIARTVDVSPSPLKMELVKTGEVAVESAIFNDFYPWLGICLSENFYEAKPVWISASGQKIPMLRVVDPKNGEDWWVQNNGWDSINKRHWSELQRSAGEYRIEISGFLLWIKNWNSSFGRTDIQAYVDDFQGELLWMIMNDNAGASAKGRETGIGTQLIDALKDFYFASQKVLAAPAVAIREGQALQSVSKLRPNPATFRDYLRNPSARRLVGRVFHESPDTAENRYLRYALEITSKAADAYRKAALQQGAFFERLAKNESKNAERNRMLKKRKVDVKVFDRQTQEIEENFQKILNFNFSLNQKSKNLEFFIKIKSIYRHKDFCFYCSSQYKSQIDGNQVVDYEFIEFSFDLFNLIQSVYHFCSSFIFVGVLEFFKGKTKSGKIYRSLRFSSIKKILPDTSILERRYEKRQYLDSRGWSVDIGYNELADMRKYADISEDRAKQASKRQEKIRFLSSEVLGVSEKLHMVGSKLEKMGISKSSVFPSGMVFVSNPDYAACLTAFRKIINFFDSEGLDLSSLEQVVNVGILHVSDIYEKWCLLKIFKMLKDFKFQPEIGWQEKLVIASLKRSCNVKFNFLRQDVDMKVILTFQAKMDTGRLPDFVLEITKEDKFLSGIVMDAKFRSSWSKNGIERLLNKLIHAKGYGQAVQDERVFILQPCDFTVNDSLSPLEWGAQCNYGGNKSHRQGWIQVGISASGSNPTEHLKRLLAMVFQKAFYAISHTLNDNKEIYSNSEGFCINCGSMYDPSDVTQENTKSGSTKLRFDCRRCKSVIFRTHCFHCRTPIFKNGANGTYHNTVADQVTNVICPNCGSYFESEMQ